MLMLMFLIALAIGLLILRPVGAVDLLEIERLTQATLPKFLGAPGESYSLINEAAGHDYLAGRLFKRAQLKWGGGTELKFPLQFSRADTAQWLHPYSEVVLKSTKPVRWGRVPWRMLGWGWYMPQAEMDVNRGKRELLIDIGQQCREDVALDLVETCEDAVLAEGGNYEHDGEGDNHLMPFGLLYWATIDGLHVTGDTGRAVGGISPHTYPGWKNPYINPVASTDGLGTITSVYDLRLALNRMMRMMKFDAIDFASFGQPIKNAPEYDPDGREKPGDLMLWCDDKTEVLYREVLFSRQDNIGYDQFQPRPVYKGLEIRGSSRLRMPAAGYGYDHSGNPLWADRTGSYASGKWPSWGRAIVINTRYFHVAVHPEHAPQQKKPYVPERRFGIAHEGDFWMQTVARSRRRGLGWIGPYNTDLNALS